MLKLFVALVVSGFSIVLLDTFFHMQFHLAGKNFLEWVFQTFPIGWIIGIGILAASALFVFGVPLIGADKLRMWYKSRQGRDLRKYDDPEFRD